MRRTTLRGPGERYVERPGTNKSGSRVVDGPVPDRLGQGNGLSRLLTTLRQGRFSADAKQAARAVTAEELDGFKVKDEIDVAAMRAVSIHAKEESKIPHLAVMKLRAAGNNPKVREQVKKALSAIVVYGPGMVSINAIMQRASLRMQ